MLSGACAGARSGSPAGQTREMCLNPATKCCILDMQLVSMGQEMLAMRTYNAKQFSERLLASSCVAALNFRSATGGATASGTGLLKTRPAWSFQFISLDLENPSDDHIPQQWLNMELMHFTTTVLRVRLSGTIVALASEMKLPVPRDLLFNISSPPYSMKAQGKQALQKHYASALSLQAVLPELG